MAPNLLQKIHVDQLGFSSRSGIARKYTCDGDDVSPPLRWENPPAGAKAFAMIADDPDAPGGTWVHWLIYDLPAETKELFESVPKTEVLTNGGKQGVNDFGKVGYGGPCPPPGDKPHRYIFTVYALKIDQLPLQKEASGAMVGYYLNQNKLGKASFTAKYGRK